MDGDGDIDVLSASKNDDKITWYENNGSESFTAHDITTSADDVNGIYAIDMDGDGDMDVLSASRNDNKITWYENSANFHLLGLIDFDNIKSYTSDIPKIAWKSSQEALGVNQMPSVSLDLRVGPNTTLYFNDNEQAFLKAIRFWENFPQPTSYIALFYSLEDKAWAVEKYINFPHYTEGMESLIDAPCTPTSCTGANSGIEAFSSVGVGVFGIDSADSWDTYRYGPMQIHEYTHAVQASPWIGEDHPTSGPQNIPSSCWLIEGQAHFAGLSVGSDNLEEYLQIREQQLKGHPVDGFQDYSAAAIIEYYDEEDCLPPNPNYSLGYTIGYLTVEVLSAIGGSESSMNLYVLMQKGETFDKAFESVYGLSWESAKPVVADVVADLIENIDET